MRATPSAEGLSIAIVEVEPWFSLSPADPDMSGYAGKVEIYLWLMKPEGSSGGARPC
jgi:hypothetical protein